jgi:hypothetical protein
MGIGLVLRRGIRKPMLYVRAQPWAFEKDMPAHRRKYAENPRGGSPPHVCVVEADWRDVSGCWVLKNKRGRQLRRPHFLGRSPRAIHGIGKSGNSRAPNRNHRRLERPLCAAYFAVKRPVRKATATTGTVMKMIQESMGRLLSMPPGERTGLRPNYAIHDFEPGHQGGQKNILRTENKHGTKFPYAIEPASAVCPARESPP